MTKPAPFKVMRDGCQVALDLNGYCKITRTYADEATATAVAAKLQKSERRRNLFMSRRGR